MAATTSTASTKSTIDVQTSISTSRPGAAWDLSRYQKWDQDRMKAAPTAKMENPIVFTVAGTSTTGT